jgi:hypothetical protein
MDIAMNFPVSYKKGEFLDRLVKYFQEKHAPCIQLLIHGAIGIFLSFSLSLCGTSDT